jgi:hypothetical protein
MYTPKDKKQRSNHHVSISQPDLFLRRWRAMRAAHVPDRYDRTGDLAMTTAHWHASHNVSGYLPMSDEPDAYATWREAMDVLVSDLEFAWDDEQSTDEQYLEAHTLMHGATDDQDFLAYTATHPDSAHDIPTAWQVISCTEDECSPDGTED